MKQAVLHVLLILTVSISVMFVSLGDCRLWDRDEPRNAGCAAEMMQRGDWVVPTFNDQLRHQKPVLLYWLIMSAYSVFGVNEFAARFWSAVLAVGTILATYAIARRLLNPIIALLSSIVLSSSLMFVVAGRAATPDSALIFFSTLGMAIYVLTTFAPKTKPGDPPRLRTKGRFFPTDWIAVSGIYTALAVGVLAKGPVAVILPCAIIGMFLLIKRLPDVDRESWEQNGAVTRLVLSCLRPFAPRHFLATFWSMKPLLGLVIVLMVAGPWYVMVGIQTEGDWLRKFFLAEHFGRATTTFENHSGAWWFYPVAILIGFFPWSVFALPTFVGLDRRLSREDHWSNAYTLLVCWVAVQVAIFTLFQTKLPSYVTPCFPALAMLTSIGLYRIGRDQGWAPALWYRLSLATMVLAGAGIGISLFFLAPKFFPGDSYLAAISMILVIGGLVALWFTFQSRPAASVVTCCVASVVYVATMFGLSTVVVDSHQQNHLILAHIKAAPAGTEIAAYRCLESSWIFYGQKPIRELSPRPVDQSANVPREKFWRPHPQLDAPSFVAAHDEVLIITTDEHLAELQQQLPSDYQVMRSTSYFLRDRNLLLVGKKDLNLSQMAGQLPDPDETIR